MRGACLAQARAGGVAFESVFGVQLHFWLDARDHDKLAAAPGQRLCYLGGDGVEHSDVVDPPQALAAAAIAARHLVDGAVEFARRREPAQHLFGAILRALR